MDKKKKQYYLITNVGRSQIYNIPDTMPCRP